jgi:probable rRNA maturation factor
LVSFNYLNTKRGPKNRKKLKSFLIKLFKKEKCRFDSLVYVFCDDEYLLEVNRRFLKHDYYTDIITFNLSGQNSKIAGEIYISTDRVLDNSKMWEDSFDKELHRVIFHGALHLIGYKDKSKVEKMKMRAKEDFYLYEYFK